MGFADILLLHGVYVSSLQEEVHGLWQVLCKNIRNHLSLFIPHASYREVELDTWQQRGFSKKSPIIKQ